MIAEAVERRPILLGVDAGTPAQPVRSLAFVGRPGLGGSTGTALASVPHRAHFPVVTVPSPEGAAA